MRPVFQIFKAAAVYAVVSVTALMAAGTAAAKDLELLAKLLVPAYLAEQFASVCDNHEPGFIDGLIGSKGNVRIFAQYVNSEITTDLSPPEAVEVLFRSAETARAAAIKETSAFKSMDRLLETDATLKWCTRSVRPFIERIFDSADRQRYDFLMLMNAAKSN